uniref:C2H2-type domain-containing protein n=1 Tax=Elaeophora elaphi TaxID=1147741 RepID=A0A0R3RJ65_9BILA
MDASNGLTCLCCQVMFRNGDVQREHYKTDWHRYNLKRKITGFPVVTEEQFKLKVIAYRKETEIEKTTETKMFICKCCSKQFQSANAYNNHLSSKKHKECETRSFGRDTMKRTSKAIVSKKEINDHHCNRFNEVGIQENGDDDDGASDGWVTDHGTDDEDFDESKIIPETVCLFCNYGSKEVEKNLIHMSVLHGFFLPDAEFCTDVYGMLHYLGLKVGSGNMCLVCNRRKKFCSLDACQKHMRDKGHCRVACSVEEMIEFEDFYDYSPMYPEGEDVDKSCPIVLTDNAYILTLPSGARIGHRSLLRYYRQRLKPVQCESKSDRERKEILKKAIIGQYKQLGWTGTSVAGFPGTLAIQRAKDVRYMKKINSKNWVNLGLNNNRLFKSRGRSDQ